MSIAVQHRRGTATEHGSFTGAEGEITYDTTNKRAVVHDGSTAGGIPLAKAADVGTLIDSIPTDMADIADGYILYYDAATASIKSKQDSGGGGGFEDSGFGAVSGDYVTLTFADSGITP